MVQLPSMGKRQHAETAEPAMGPPPPLVSAAAVKVEAEEIGYAGHGPFSKRAKAAQPAPPPQQVVDPSAFTAFRFCAFVWDRAGFSAGQIVFGGKP
jgi:hypothetical protein